jgi:hypothetical protein
MKMTPRGEDVDPTQWLELFQPFTHARDLYVSGQRFLKDMIIQALVTENMAAGVLPELIQLSLRGICTPAAVETAKQFVAARKLSGHTIHLSL